jgi:hypothetical protein
MNSINPINYAGDFSSGFTETTLVNKKFVDDLVAAVEAKVNLLESTVAAIEPESTDLTPINNDITILKADLETLSTQLNGLVIPESVDLTPLTDRVEGLETTVAGLSNYDDSVLSQRITDVEGNIASIVIPEPYNDTQLSQRVTTVEGAVTGKADSGHTHSEYASTGHTHLDMVKSVNGNLPDDLGNVTINIEGGSGGGAVDEFAIVENGGLIGRVAINTTNTTLNTIGIGASPAGTAALDTSNQFRLGRFVTYSTTNVAGNYAYIRTTPNIHHRRDFKAIFDFGLYGSTYTNCNINIFLGQYPFIGTASQHSASCVGLFYESAIHTGWMVYIAQKDNVDAYVPLLDSNGVQVPIITDASYTMKISYVASTRSVKLQLRWHTITDISQDNVANYSIDDITITTQTTMNNASYNYQYFSGGVQTTNTSIKSFGFKSLVIKQD